MTFLMMFYESISCSRRNNTHEATFKIGILAHLHMKIRDMGFVESTKMVNCAFESTQITHVKS